MNKKWRAAKNLGTASSHTSRLETMSETWTETHCHLSKDGLYYETYQQMVDANVRANQEHLKALGLDKKVIDMKPPKKSSSSAPRRAALQSKSGNQEEPRRSKRVRKQAPETAPLDFSEETEKVVRVVKKQRSRTVQDSMVFLSEEERQKLRLSEATNQDGEPEWLDQMARYLITVEKLSDGNFRSVMRQVRKLLSNEGITYRHWKAGISFCPRSIDLEEDFEALLREAVKFEDEHGKDLGNGECMKGFHAIFRHSCSRPYTTLALFDLGWLLTHPIKKLANFQRYYLENLQKEN